MISWISDPVTSLSCPFPISAELFFLSLSPFLSFFPSSATYQWLHSWQRWLLTMHPNHQLLIVLQGGERRLNLSPIVRGHWWTLSGTWMIWIHRYNTTFSPQKTAFQGKVLHLISLKLFLCVLLSHTPDSRSRWYICPAWGPSVKNNLSSTPFIAFLLLEHHSHLWTLRATVSTGHQEVPTGALAVWLLCQKPDAFSLG